MSDTFSSILGQIFNNPGKGGAAGAAGGLTGILGLINQMSLAQKQKQALDRSLWYAKNPTAIGQLTQSLTQPLSQSLVKGTENTVNASLAEQGLSQAPGQQSQVLAQALAPYQQNEQQMALTEALKAIGLPAEALSSLNSVNNPQQLALMLKGILPQASPTPAGGVSGGTSTPGLTSPNNSAGATDSDGWGDLTQYQNA